MRQTIKQYLALLLFFCVMVSTPNVVYAEESEMVGELDTIISEVSAEGETGPQTMVSLGDSYSSGEGIEPFYHQDSPDKKNDPDWLGHRSEKCWSGQLKLPNNDQAMSAYKEGDDIRWYFVATSGAETCHFYDSFDKKVSGSDPIEAQLKVFEKLEPGTVDYVTLTIGGNDVKFADIITDCLIAGIPFLDKNRLSNRFEMTWNAFYNGDENGESIKSKIKNAYIDISEKAGPQAHILVAGYPQLLSKDKNAGKVMSFLLKDENIDLVNSNVTKFNSELASIVAECQADMDIRFVSVEEAFAGHEAYAAKDPYINPIILKTTEQDISKKPPSAYSIHPNEKGARVYATCVQAAIDEIEGTSPHGGTSGSWQDLDPNFASDDWWNQIIEFFQKWMKDIEEQAIDVISD